MRTAPVVFWVVVAAVLGVLLVISQGLARRGGGAEARAAIRLVPDAADVRAVGAERADGGVVVVQRVGEGWPTGWAVRTRETDRTETWWPASDDRVRAGLRLLSSAELDRRGGEPIEGPTRSVSVAPSQGRPVELRLGERALGGRIAAEIEGGPGVWVDSRLADALRGEALLLWRDDRLLSVAGPATGLSVRTAGAEVGLVREGGVWSILGEPALPVDREAVARTLESLAAVRASQVLGADLTTAGERGLSQERAVLEVRSAGGWRRLALGAATDAAGKGVFARATGELAGQALAGLEVRVEAAPLGRVSAAAVDYIARSPVDPGRWDVARVEVLGADGRVRLDAAREPGGWGGTEEDARIDALLAVLTREPGTVRLDPGGERAGTVRLHGADGRGMTELEVLRGDGGLGVALQGQVLRVGWAWTSAEAQQALGWAAARSHATP